MRLLSANPQLLSNKILLSPLNPQTNNSKLFSFSSSPLSLKPLSQSKSSPISASLPSPTTTTTTTTTIPTIKTPKPLTNWPEFANRVSGEWDGFGADFTPAGSLVELPENVVPEAYREWEVQVFDWQTQCPTLASETGDPVLSYKLIKLLPTVGCEADAATRHSVEERTAGGEENAALGLGYSVSGCYVGVWGIEGFGGRKGLEVEHCLVDPGNWEVRVRVVMVVRVVEEGRLEMARVQVFSEQWYGPWRNGEQLGGCAVRESGFALSERVEVGDVVGVWEGRSFGVARFGREAKDVLQELVQERPQNSIRDQGLIALPKNLWCSFKEKEDGKICAEVGWLLDRGNAITSRCVLLKDGTLKELAIGQETAVLEEK